MSESKEKVNFMKRPFALAESSRQYIERLWKIGVEVSKFGASLASFFSSIYNTLAGALSRIVGFGNGIRELSLTRITFLPSFDLWTKEVTSPEEEDFSAQMGRANVSFLIKSMVARKIAGKLASKLAAKSPKLTLLLEPALLDAGIMEKAVKESRENVPHIIADLKGRFESKLAPSIKGIVTSFQEYRKKAILPTPLLTMPKSLLIGPTGLKRPTSRPFVSPLEAEAKVRPSRVVSPEMGSLMLAAKPSIERIEPPVPMPLERIRRHVISTFQYAARLPGLILKRALPTLKRLAVFSVGPPSPAAVSNVTFLPSGEVNAIASPLVSIAAIRLKSEAARSIGYAVGLPSIFLPQASPILETTAVSPPVSSIEPSSPSSQTSYRRPSPTAPSPMHPSLVSRLLEEISPSLTSWIYGVSEVLRGTTLSLSAVPVAASAAEKVVTEALIQPIPTLEAPMTRVTHELVSPVLTSPRRRASVRPAKVEAFRLPALVTSLIVALGQRYPLLLGEPTSSEAYGASFELTQFVPEETAASGEMPEKKSFSKLPTVIALAAAETLIAQKLHHEFGTLIRQMQVARSSYGGKLVELGTFTPIGTPVLSRLRAAAPAAHLSPTIEPYTPTIKFAPSPLPRLEPISPPIQNTFNITISAESAEEDLRDLERKISRILSDQIRRYYGSSRM